MSSIQKIRKKEKLKILFRTDGSSLIGLGHLSRCLTLANYFKSIGMNCTFVCRESDIKLKNIIDIEGHSVKVLNKTYKISTGIEDTEVPHSSWLETDWETDAFETINSISGNNFDILFIDHYSLDYKWINLIREHVKKVVVIDDLADRVLNCDFLIDQTLGRDISDYKDLLGPSSISLVGSKFSILRPEFIQKIDEAKVKRQETSKVKTILISLGGVDKDNITKKIIESLLKYKFVKDLQINVVLGAGSSHFDDIKSFADLKSNVKVFFNIKNMSDFILDADLAFGAGGSSSWERCVLGLPSINVVLSKNQEKISSALEESHLGFNIGYWSESKTKEILEKLSQLRDDASIWHKFSKNCFNITDGKGIKRISKVIMKV